MWKWTKYFKEKYPQLDGMPWLEKKSKYKNIKKANKKYGFDIRETWNLDYTFCYWIITRLSRLKKSSGVPYIEGATDEEMREAYCSKIDRIVNAASRYITLDEDVSDFEERQRVMKEEIKPALMEFIDGLEGWWD